MSISKQFVAAADGKRAVPVEKKNFTQACNLLNQYLKEKGSLRDLNINGKLESIGRPETSQASTTIDFLSSMENPSPAPAPAPAPVVRTSTPVPAPAPGKSLPPLPEIIDVESFIAGKASNSSKQAATVEAKTAAMTIFYGGQVLVFNDFSEEKVREIMLLASSNNNSAATTAAGGGNDKIDRGKAPLTSLPLPPTSFSTLGSNAAQAINVEANGSDLPIARRASLHKFLAKRKDRATARAAPYQVTTSSSRKDEPNFDLNL